MIVRENRSLASVLVLRTFNAVFQPVTMVRPTARMASVSTNRNALVRRWTENVQVQPTFNAVCAAGHRRQAPVPVYAAVMQILYYQLDRRQWQYGSFRGENQEKAAD